MKRRRTRLMIFCMLLPVALAVLAILATPAAATGDDRALILVDEQSPAAIYPAPEATLANLLGHFDFNVETRPIESYTSGEIENYHVTFYLGSYWDHALPAEFLEDVLTTGRQVVWINYNLWSLAWGEYGPAFESRYGFSYVQTLPTEGFTQVTYGGRSFVRGQDEFAQTLILDDSLALTPARVTDGAASYPYIIKSGNFFFVSDNPLEQTAEESPYLVFADLLHEMVLIDHPANHRALVRIEDIDPTEDPARIRAIADYLYSQGVPFSMAVIPRFADPLDATAAPAIVDLADSPELVEALVYATERGGTIVMHGITHQYDATANPYNGVTGLDSEFARLQNDPDGNLIYLEPLPEDSAAWVQDRIATGYGLFAEAGLPVPYIWETPHYLASDLDHQAFGSAFSVSYERFADSYFPYIIDRTVYGSRLIPENLGYVSPAVVSPQKIINRAGRNLAVRDGFASFFFHPELDLSYLQSTVSGIKAKGYTFADVKLLADGAAPVVAYAGPSGPIGTGDATLSATYTDPQPSAGIDAATATVRLGSGVTFACSAGDGIISCPVNGLPDGMYTAEVSLSDNAGYAGLAAGSFTVDTAAPEISGVLPSGTIYKASQKLSASYTDGAGSGIDTASAVMTLDGASVVGLTSDPAGVSCQVSDLRPGTHELYVSVADLAGNRSSAASTFFLATCSGEAPDLALGSAVPYWASFADYRARMLTVTFGIRNLSVRDAYAVTIVRAECSEGVVLAGGLPAPLDIQAGDSCGVRLAFSIPHGVTGFHSVIHATASDACGNEFSYPHA